MISSMTRQRTNTTIGLQSQKMTSVRQSMNNLSLKELMEQPNALQKPVSKQQSTRGSTQGKLTGAISVNFNTTVGPSFKSS